MKPEIGFTSLLISQNILNDVDFAIKHNFDWLEICFDWQQNFNLPKNIPGKIRILSSKHNLKIIVHTPYYLPTATILPELKKAVIENITKAILFAKSVNSDRITIHPGFYEMPTPAKKLNNIALIKNLEEIVAIAQKENINICLENFNNDTGLLCVELEEFKNTLSLIKNIKATLDVGHANTSKTLPAIYFKGIEKYIMNMHIHDNHGKIDEHNCLGEGVVDFKALFDACKMVGYNGPFILELFPYKNVLKGKEKLIKIWNN